MVLRTALSFVAATADPVGPPDLQKMECAVHLYALEFGVERLPNTDFSRDLHDALNIDQICDAEMRQKAEAVMKQQRPRRGLVETAQGVPQFFVAVDGNDGAAGDIDKPFATLERARDAVRSASGSGGVIRIRAGKYYLSRTLELSSADEGLAIEAYNGEKVIISGARSLQGLGWSCADSDCKILQASVQLPSPGRLGTTAGPSCGNEDDTDFSGHDLATTKADSPADCCAKCSNTAGCNAWTIEHKAMKGARCWLKKSDAGRKSYEDHVSGVLGKPPTPPTPPTPPPPPPPAHVFGPAPEIVNQLFVDGVRQVRARYPNANPQHGDGKCFSATQRPGEGCAAWLNPSKVTGTLPAGTKVATVQAGPNRGDSPTQGCGKQCHDYGSFKYTIYDPPEGHPVYNKPLPGLGWQNNSLFSFWGSPFARPAEVHSSDLPRSWSRPETGILHMFHSGLWGGWSFRIAQRDSDALHLGYGGYQEARGSRGGKHFYVENLREELDSPQEWFYDDQVGKLFWYPNSTNTSSPFLKDADVAVPLLDSLITIRGESASKPASGITLSGLEFTETRATFMDMYEVPSGGDWSIHRGGAVFIEDAEIVNVTACTFNQTGGNAIFLSRHVTDSFVVHNEFTQTGDSAIALVGITDAIDATSPTYPNNNRIAGNHIREYGVYGKQTSCFFQALSANTTFEDNVCYNGPRAGINMNDGFGGGNRIQRNLLFNHVRETGDHGPFNSWDRQPYLTQNGVDDGFTDDRKFGLKGASIVKAQCYVENNFIINGYNGVWAIDHDDGSQYYNDTANFMVWGGCKNYRGHSKSCDHNLIIFPGITERSAGKRRCQSDDNGIFANQYFHGNDCVSGDGVAYSFNRCNPDSLETTVYETANNTFYAPNATFLETDCKNQWTLKEWQDHGQDVGSSAARLPDETEIIEMARKKLGSAATTTLLV